MISRILCRRMNVVGSGYPAEFCTLHRVTVAGSSPIVEASRLSALQTTTTTIQRMLADMYYS